MKEAKQIVKHIIDNISLTGLGYYQGVIDINSSCINFQEIASQFNLKENQYNKLINYSQKLAEKKLKITAWNDPNSKVFY